MEVAVRGVRYETVCRLIAGATRYTNARRCPTNTRLRLGGIDAAGFDWALSAVLCR